MMNFDFFLFYSDKNYCLLVLKVNFTLFALTENVRDTGEVSQTQCCHTLSKYCHHQTAKQCLCLAYLGSLNNSRFKSLNIFNPPSEKHGTVTLLEALSPW